jgi:peptidoglycan hydrolase CwlO-like protein
MEEKNVFSDKFKLEKKNVWVYLLILVLVIFVAFGLFGKKSTNNQPSDNQNQPGATATVSIDEAQKKLKAIQDQVSAGTLSPEEAAKLMKDLGPQIAPPPLPPEAKKQ